MPRVRRLVILHSTRAADRGVTKYATHMAATAGDGIRPEFFTWPRALFGRYDVFHLHWPEGLVGTAHGVRGTVSYALTRMLLVRLRRGRIPVVYTLHNHAPHDGDVSRRLKTVYDAFERLTAEEIHLVPEPGRVPRAAAATIPHGGYVEAFAPHPRRDAVPGRALFFGIMRPYKGVEELLDVFAKTPGDDRTLRLVGQPQDAALRQRVEEAAAADRRITRRFGFLPDRELVTEVTAAQLVVLPYRELHSSGAVLVALSLGRPVLIPDGSTAQALRAEVGADWVRTYSGPLTPTVLDNALERARTLPARPPDLAARSRERVRRAHLDVYRRAVAPAASGETVFAWLWGQDDNIGDSALRRGYADALRARGPLVVYVGGVSAAYVSGLGLQPGDRVVADLADWLRDAAAAARRGPVTIAINAGEFSFSGTYALTLVRMLPALRRLRRHGATVVWLGAAVPAARRGVTWLFRRLFRAADLVRWRDAETSAVFEAAPSMPDWALGLPPAGGEHGRTALGVSLRFDRPYPSPEWIDAVRDLASRLALDVVAVAQVRRDSDYARRLAHDLGGRAVVFDDLPHAAQERLLRGEYAAMRALLSDRLHALLIAQTEGVVPLGWAEAATGKLRRHFDALGMPWATTPPGRCIDRIRTLDDDRLEALAGETAKRLAVARADLAEVRAALAGDQRPPAARANTSA